MLVLWLRMAWQLWCNPQAPPAARQFGLLFLAFVGVWFPNAMFQDVLMIPMVNMLLLFVAGLVVNLAAVSHAAAMLLAKVTLIEPLSPLKGTQSDDARSRSRPEQRPVERKSLFAGCFDDFDNS